MTSGSASFFPDIPQKLRSAIVDGPREQTAYNWVCLGV
jgi:hypothetical protein